MTKYALGLLLIACGAPAIPPPEPAPIAVEPAASPWPQYAERPALELELDDPIGPVIPPLAHAASLMSDARWAEAAVELWSFIETHTEEELRAARWLLVRALYHLGSRFSAYSVLDEAAQNGGSVPRELAPFLGLLLAHLGEEYLTGAPLRGLAVDEASPDWLRYLRARADLMQGELDRADALLRTIDERSPYYVRARASCEATSRCASAAVAMRPRTSRRSRRSTHATTTRANGASRRGSPSHRSTTSARPTDTSCQVRRTAA